MRKLLPRVLLPATLLAAILTGCAPTVSLQPADDAINPICAEVAVRLPDTVAGLPARETNAQATGAWGEPASVILRCGVPVPPPTAEFPCLPEPIGGVDWLRDDSDDPNFVFTTYGRDPAVQVIINSDEVSGLEALTDLADAVAIIPAEAACIGIGDVE